MRVSMRVCENMNMTTNPPNWVGARGRFLTIYPKQRHFALRFWQTELQGHTLLRVACQPNFETRISDGPTCPEFDMKQWMANLAPPLRSCAECIAGFAKHNNLYVNMYIYIYTCLECLIHVDICICTNINIYVYLYIYTSIYLYIYI